LQIYINKMLADLPNQQFLVFRLKLLIKIATMTSTNLVPTPDTGDLLLAMLHYMTDQLFAQ